MKSLFIVLLLSGISATAQESTPKKQSNNSADATGKEIASGNLLQRAMPKPATITPCAGGNVTIPAGIAGSSYQWQVNTGSGTFTNVSNGGLYSGATTNTLQITGAPSSIYGYEFRCVADGNNGPVTILKFIATWTGAVDNSWENGTNWNCGSVPDANTDVIVNSGTPALNSNRSVRTLTLGFGIIVTINTSFELMVVR